MLLEFSDHRYGIATYIIESVIPGEPKPFDLLCCRLASESTPAVYVCTSAQANKQSRTLPAPVVSGSMTPPFGPDCLLGPPQNTPKKSHLCTLISPPQRNVT